MAAAQFLGKGIPGSDSNERPKPLDTGFVWARHEQPDAVAQPSPEAAIEVVVTSPLPVSPQFTTQLGHAQSPPVQQSAVGGTAGIAKMLSVPPQQLRYSHSTSSLADTGILGAPMGRRADIAETGDENTGGDPVITDVDKAQPEGVCCPTLKVKMGKCAIL